VRMRKAHDCFRLIVITGAELPALDSIVGPNLDHSERGCCSRVGVTGISGTDKRIDVAG
jgi:hypothetical protein